MGWGLVGLQGWTEPVAQAFSFEGEQTAVFLSRAGGSRLSAIVFAVPTALPLPRSLVLAQRSSPDAYTDANRCAGLSSLTPTCDVFLISLSSEKFATHLVLACIPL